MISVILPTYNEKENIEMLVSALEKSMKEEHEIIVVDDGSPDGTAEIVKSLAKGFPSLRLVERSGKQGLSSAIVAGISSAKGNHIVVMDADLSHPPERVLALASNLKNYDLAIGSRLMKGGGVKTWPFHRKMISKGAELLARFILGVKVSDPLSGFFAIRKNIFEKTRIRTEGYKILLNILADNRNLRVKEIPYVFSDRHAGKTKLGLGETVTYLLDVMRIRLG